MKSKFLHIVHGGVDNGDKKHLEKIAKIKTDTRWTVPKSATLGDDIVIYIGGYGFFATATVDSYPKPRTDWANRYAAQLTNIKLIEPPISLGAIQKHVPSLSWANFPRSITTPDEDTSNEIRKLISLRKKTGIPDLDTVSINNASIVELRKIAILASKSSLKPRRQSTLHRAGSEAIKRYVLLRSKGICEGCNKPAPFKRPDGTPYLEPHHTIRRADDGPDHPKYVIALCPNCHRRAEYSMDSKIFNEHLIQMLSKLEPK